MPRIVKLSIFARAAALSFFLVAALSTTAFAETTFTFKGGGWGHGIGMSQYGAGGYADQGWSYSKILAHYYQGTGLRTMPTQKVRVNLNSTAKSRSGWRLQSGTSSDLTIAQVGDSTKKLTVAAATSVWVTVSNGNTRVQADLVDSSGNHKPDPNKVLKQFSGECWATSGSLVKLHTVSGPYDRSGVSWRGTIHFVPTTSTTSKAVNYVDLESYLYGVVPCEIPSGWAAEALKAQAVAARSYAYPAAKAGSTIYCTTSSQVYGGYPMEKSTTNNAVKATAGKVVYYAPTSKVVQTFFFSSSGGHTANIEDVWTLSDPQPYYTGVPDADQASPNYTWTAGPLTATTVAQKIRAKDTVTGEALPVLDYSAPAPYVVTSIATERAPSGYTHHVTVRWSNGASYRISGDTLRSALGMKSTKFSVTVAGQTVSTAYADTNPKLAYWGRWGTMMADAAYGDSMHSSIRKSSSVTARFTGSGITWYGAKGPYYGKADVYLDGTKVATVDCYATSNSYRRALFTRTGLTDTEHTVRIVVRGDKHASSRGYRVTADRFTVLDGALLTESPKVLAYEESHQGVAWLGEWETRSSAEYSGGTQILSTSERAEVHLDFYGNAIAWIGSVSPAHGRARVTLDGKSIEVELTRPDGAYQQTLWSAAGLDQSKLHTLVIAPLGPASGGTSGYCTVDRLDVTGGWALKPTLPLVRLQENSRSVSYTGTWTRSTDSLHSGGAHRYSHTAGSTATLEFEGTSVKWIGTKAPMYGRAEVYLDGVKVSTVDQYSASRRYQQTIFSRSGLPSRPHTLTIKVLGSKQSAATGTNVAIDAFLVNGRGR